MGNIFSSTSFIKLNVDQEVRYLLCPSRESENLDLEMQRLKSIKLAVETQCMVLHGQSGVAVREDVVSWISAVDVLDSEVAQLLLSLNRHRPLFRFLCCCLHPGNYGLGQQVASMLKQIATLKTEHAGWNNILTRPTRPLRGSVEMMGDELKKLEAFKKDLKMSIDEEIMSADGRKQCSNEVEDWFRKVDRLIMEVRIFEIQLAEGPEITNEEESRQISEKISAKRVEIKDLYEEGDNLRQRKGDLLRMATPEKYPDVSGSLPKFIVGVEEDITKISKYLKDDEVSIIGIHGMGGVGKTTLVKKIVMKLRSSELPVEFDLVVLSSVSRKPNISKIQEDIADRLGLKPRSNEARGIYTYFQWQRRSPQVFPYGSFSILLT